MNQAQLSFTNTNSQSLVFILFFSGSHNIFNWEIEDTSLISDLFKKPDLVYAVAYAMVRDGMRDKFLLEDLCYRASTSNGSSPHVRDG